MAKLPFQWIDRMTALLIIPAAFILFAMAVAWSAKDLMTRVGKHLRKAFGPPSKFDRRTPR